MPNLNLIILYVEDTARSAAFYEGILGRKAVAELPGFSAFSLDGGMTLGLWARRGVKPEPSEAGDRGELAFMVEDRAAIEALHADWKARGLPIRQEITTMDFGPTFVALDPDGHRLRACLFDQ